MGMKKRGILLAILLFFGIWGGVLTPALAASSSILINPTSGPWGTTVTVTGSDFGNAETPIVVTYGGTTVTTNPPTITANSQGAWSATFIVPASSSGSHIVTATGPTNTASTTFTTPSVAISLSPTSGVSGSSVAINGSGFGAYESGVTVTYDGTAVSTGTIIVSSQGAWTTTYKVPASSPGSHIVDAYGSTTTAASVSNVTFIVPSVAISLSTTSGASGSSVTIVGSGFSATETGITITYDGSLVTSGIIAGSEGIWSANFVVPPSAAGTHKVDAFGSITKAADVPEVTFTVTGGISLNQSTGISGSSMTVTGSGFGAAETGITVTYDGTSMATGIIASSQGAWNATFTVPASSPGSHTVDAYGSVTTVANVPNATFTVPKPAVSLSKTSGVSGSQVTVTGSGFGYAETGITVTYDGDQVVMSITASSQGTWSTTLIVPASVSGAHDIAAFGSITQAAYVPEATFIIRPGISLSQSTGASGTSITVTGSGFSYAETGITITYDGTQVTTGITASSQGAWTATFVVPASASGTHSIRAYGQTTQTASVSEVSFIVGAGISVSRSTGASGSSITVTGSGFGAAEKGITVTYDGTPVATGITASSQGSWTTTFNVPTSAFGLHNIDAYGSTTQAVSVDQVGFNVVPSISISPTSGYVGTTIKITGSGFSANSALSFIYDDKEISGAQATTDASGSFVGSISAPKSKTGDHSISALDSQRNEARTTFTIKSVTPDTPSLISPKNGARLSILGNISPTLQWSAVTNDPNGVSYTLQIDTNANFSNPILEIANIASTSYDLTGAESLSRGQYYWRVKAVDAASNESAWSKTFSLKSGLMALWTFMLIILLCIAAAIGIVYFIIVMLRRRRQKAIVVPTVEPSPALGEWRESRPEETYKQIAASWRKALPRASKGAKQLSPEEQSRIKLVAEFAQSLPLEAPGFTADWIVSRLESTAGTTASPLLYEQLLQDQIQVRYEPEWTSHYLYQELKTVLSDHPVAQELSSFVETVNRCGTESSLLLKEIYRECIAEIPSDFLKKGGWGYISAVYTDTLGWFRGKSLQEPSERDYAMKWSTPEGDTDVMWLYGEGNTSFAGPLIEAQDEKEAQRLRTLHLKLRRKYRTSERAKQLVGMITKLQLQRERLVSALAQISRLPD